MLWERKFRSKEKWYSWWVAKGDGIGIRKFLKDKKIIVTGATGFIAKGNYDFTSCIFMYVRMYVMHIYVL